MTTEVMVFAALAYASVGWSVFPVPPGQKKSYKSASRSGGAKWGKTKDPAEIRRDWQAWPDANIGLPTGKDSGFWVLEADTHAGHGVDGIASLAALVARHEPLPETRVAVSPSGSVHYYFKWPEGAEIKNSTSKVAPGVDVRGEGGMVVAPPSIRRDGSYKWRSEGAPAEAPGWLIGLCREASRRPRREDRETQVDVERLRAALSVIPNENPSWHDWNNMGMAIWSATGGTSEGLELFHLWSQKWTGYVEDNTTSRWRSYHSAPPTNIGAGTIFYRASEACPGWDRITVEDFYSYLPMHNYIFIPTRDHWPASSINSILPKKDVLDSEGNPVVDGSGRPRKIKPTTWLDQNRKVDQMTWAPGHPTIIKDKVVTEGGWLERRGATTFNRYRAPNLIRGSSARAGPWLDHCDKVLASSRSHVVSWLAHRIQKPFDKINHAVVMGGAPGIGKDTLLEPVKRAVGSWNFAEASPTKMLGQFTAKYLQAVVLRISEARDLGDVNRYAFYEHMKTMTAAPPDVINVNEKFIQEYAIFNCVGIVYTTNYKHGGLYLPADDRRHYVVWSDSTAADFDSQYWDELWGWYDGGGDAHVASYLADLDIADFNPKEAPPRTEAFWDIVHANDSPEDAELADVIDHLGNPSALIVAQIKEATAFGSSDFEAWLSDKRTSRIIPHRLEKCGYVAVRNPDSADGIWKVRNKRTPIYAKRELSLRDQIEAARACKTRVENAASGGPHIVRS